MLKFLLSIASVLLTIIPFIAFGQYTSKQSSEVRFDTSNTAILEFKKPPVWIFDSAYKSAKLNQNDLSVIDGFLRKAVDDFNSWQEKNNPNNAWKIDLKSHHYNKQLVAVINEKGEKEVWVNCFCTVDDASWKSELVIVVDGGTCFFNFKINLSTKAYYDFRVNSEG